MRCPQSDNEISVGLLNGDREIDTIAKNIITRLKMVRSLFQELAHVSG